MAEATRYIEKAEKLVQKGKLEDAVQEYLMALAADPNNVQIIDLVAELYLRLGHQGKGLECYSYLFDKLREKGEAAKAALVFRKMMKLGPQEPERLMQYGQLIEKSKPDEAAGHYQAAAHIFRERREKTLAAEATARMAKLDPDNIDLQCLLGESANDAGQYEMAAAAFMQASELQRAMPGNRGGQLNALPLIERAFKMAPHDRAIAVKLAQALAESGAPERVVALLAPLAAAPGAAPEIQKLLGEASIKIGDFAHAQLALLPLAASAPEAQASLWQVVQALVGRQQNEEAVHLLGRLREIMFHGGRGPDFITQLEGLPAEVQNTAPVLEYQVSLYQELGYDKQQRKAQLRLFDLLFAEGNFLRAAEVVEQVAEIDPFDQDASQRVVRLNGKIDARRCQSLAQKFRVGGAPAAPVVVSPRETAPVDLEAPAIPGSWDASAPPAEPHSDGPGQWASQLQHSFGEAFKDVGESTEAPAAAAGGGEGEESTVLDDLVIQAEIFMQYGLKPKAIERLERVRKLFPGEEDKNDRLRSLMAAAGLQVKAPGARPGAPAKAAVEGEEAVDFAKVSEITRNINRQGTVKNVLFAVVNDVGRAWRASKCVASLCTPGKTPSVLLEYCATGQKQSEALNLVRLVHGTMRLSPDGTPLAVEDAESSAKLAPMTPVVRALGIRSLLALPMMEGNQQIGVLILEQCDRRRTFHANEVMVVKTIVDQMVMAVSHVKLRSLMKSLAVTDERTGLLNRSSYIDCLLAETSRAQREGSQYCVALLQFGAGNQLIKEKGEESVKKFMDEVGGAVASHMRQNDVAVRYDSTTLALVLPGTKGSDGPQVMDKMRKVLAGVRLADKTPPLTWGLAEPLLDEGIDAVDSVTIVINRAEEALAEAHKEGGNTGKLLAL